LNVTVPPVWPGTRALHLISGMVGVAVILRGCLLTAGVMISTLIVIYSWFRCLLAHLLENGHPALSA
jgi:hypothetical protein